MRVDLILPNLGYTGFAFPEVVFQPAQVQALRVSPTGSDNALLTERVASMDQIARTLR